MSMCTCIAGTKTHNQVSSYTYSHQSTNRHIDFDMDSQVLGVNSWRPATQSLNEAGSDRLSPLATTNFLKVFLAHWRYPVKECGHPCSLLICIERQAKQTWNVCIQWRHLYVQSLLVMEWKNWGHLQKEMAIIRRDPSRPRRVRDGSFPVFLCSFCQKQISTWSFAAQHRPIKPIEMLPFTSVYRRCWRQWWSSPWERARRLLSRPQ